MVSEHVDLMAQKKIEIRVEVLEKKMKELKYELKRLQGLEKSIEHLKQGMTKMLQSMEEIEKTVAALNFPKGAMNRSGSDLEANISEKFSAWKSEELEKDYKQDYEILTPSVENFTEQMRMRRGHAVKEDGDLRSRSVIAEHDVEDGGKGFVNGLVQGKIVEEMLLNLVGLDCGIEVAQQLDCKVPIINKVLDGMGLNEIKVNGPTDYNPRTHHIILITNPLLQSGNIFNSVLQSPNQNSTNIKPLLGAMIPRLHGKGLYHRWREKESIGHHNKNKGLQDPVVHKLPLPSTCNIHLVLYVSQLRNKARGDRGGGASEVQLPSNARKGPARVQWVQDRGKWPEETVAIGINEQYQEGGNWGRISKIETLFFERFLGIKPVVSVEEFRRNFEALAALLQCLVEKLLESNFINGLTPNVRVEIRWHLPKGLGQIMDMAQLIEDRNTTVKPPNETVGSKFSKLGRIRAETKGDYAFQTRIVTVGATGYGVCLDSILLVFSQSAQSLGLNYSFSASTLACIRAKEIVKPHDTPNFAIKSLPP